MLVGEVRAKWAIPNGTCQAITADSAAVRTHPSQLRARSRAAGSETVAVDVASSHMAAMIARTTFPMCHGAPGPCARLKSTSNPTSEMAAKQRIGGRAARYAKYAQTQSDYAGRIDSDHECAAGCRNAPHPSAIPDVELMPVGGALSPERDGRQPQAEHEDDDRRLRPPVGQDAAPARCAHDALTASMTATPTAMMSPNASVLASREHQPERQRASYCTVERAGREHEQHLEAAAAAHDRILVERKEREGERAQSHHRAGCGSAARRHHCRRDAGRFSTHVWPTSR
jgi:hypothetical protein